MADTTGNSTNNGGGPADLDGQPDFQGRVVVQYIKDMSFENPNVLKLIGGQESQPKRHFEVDVKGASIGPDTYESAIHFRAKIETEADIVFELELVYGGLFELKNMPEEALEPFLLVNAPALLFPFMRRIIADVTSDGGYPPLLLDPIDFGGLYMNRKENIEANTDGEPEPKSIS